MKFRHNWQIIQGVPTDKIKTPKSDVYQVICRSIKQSRHLDQVLKAQSVQLQSNRFTKLKVSMGTLKVVTLTTSMQLMEEGELEARKERKAKND